MVRLNIRLRITLAFTLLILVFSAVSGYVAFTLIRQTAEKGAANKARSDLALGATLIDTLHPGDWEVRDGALYKGETRMNDNYALVDLIAERTGGTATIFQGDTRVATTVKVADTGQRATGTKAAENVVQRVLKEGQDYLGEALVAGNKFQTAYTPLRDASGEIVGMWYVGVSKAFLDELLRTAGLQLFLATSLMLLLSAVAAWVFARSFSQPLAALSAVVADVEAGELNRRFALPRGDEIGQLGQRFNQMVGTVSGVIRGIADASRQVAQAAQDLKQSSDSFTEANSSIANAIQTVAAGSESQVKLTDGAVQAVQAVVQQINEVARDSAEVSRVAQAAAATAASGVTAIERAVSQMSSVGETMEGFSGTIRALGERSQQIGQIVDLITGIADQTNLLALNAAIEAARAGEQGRGFAVVAEEVRKLAEQSAEAAKKIAGLVQEIQGDTARAVELMDVETGQVDEGINVVNEAGAAFRGLVESIETLSERIGRVTAATAAMNQNSGQVASAMDGIAEAARRAAGQASEVAAGSEAQFATLEQLASLAGSLMELAEKLSASVQAFKV